MDTGELRQVVVERRGTPSLVTVSQSVGGCFQLVPLWQITKCGRREMGIILIIIIIK